ncbi:MAG: NAD(P)H-dependent oxidoreductase subunit E [Xanthomonadales bacterium]|nr:NAD(P)H-dependent oxidoreductase subunit E [Xanthomonadales bacterium]
MSDISRFVSGLLSNTDDAPDQLLQHLCSIQHHYAHIPEEAIQLLSERLVIPRVEIVSIVYFYAFLHMHDRGDFDILFSDNITDRMLGNLPLLESMCKKLGVEPGEPRADGRVSVELTSCTGLCDQGPALLVNGIAVSRLDEDRVHKMVGLIEAGIPVSNWPKKFFEIEDNIQRRDKLLDDVITHGSAIEAFAVKGGDALLDSIEKSGLRGRGGAGFKAASKWRICRDAPGEEHYVLCNADEGEPGTFKDRILLNSYANIMYEGMTICGGIIGAKKGYLYLRGEYLYLRQALEDTLQERRDAGLLGMDILGREGFDFDIEIHMGAGAYICGEESAMIESMEGKRGIPRDRPPYPVTQGYKGQPSVVNNVETFVAAARIAVFGADWFSSAGTEQSCGTKLLSISGDCARPGIYEYPYGISIRQILEDCGAEDTQAVQVSGAAGFTIPPQEFYRTIAFEDIPTGGSFMIFNQQRDLLEMVQNFNQFFCHESCGFCTPCRIGGTLMKDLLNKVIVGHATAYDLNEMKKIGLLMKKTAHCGLGTTAPNPILDTMEKFPGIYSKRLLNRSYEPAFDLDAALEDSRHITGRDDEAAHIRYER